MADFKKNFSAAEWGELLSYCTEKSYPMSSTILEKGQIDQTMYYLKSGVADIIINNIEDKSIKVGDISQGALFGELSFLDGHPRAAAIVAQTDVDLWELKIDKFKVLKSKNIELAFKLLWHMSRLIGHRLRITNSMLKASLQEESLVDQPDTLKDNQIS